MPREDATETLRQALQTALGRSLEPAPSAHVAGGSIGECVRWSSDDGDLFVKLAPVERQAALEAEAAGLAELDAAAAIRVPALLGTGTAASTAWLALRWIDFTTPVRRSEALLGEQLASLHRVGGAALRLASRQHDRCDAAAQCVGRRLGTVLRPTPPRHAARPR